MKTNRTVSICRQSTLQRGLVGGLSLALWACSPPADAPPADEQDVASLQSELITRMQGSSIASPNVDKSKTYLSVRSIRTLNALGSVAAASARARRPGCRFAERSRTRQGSRSAA